MKNIFTLLFVVLGFNAVAQISFDKDSSIVIKNTSDFEIAAKAQLTNNSTDTLYRIIRTAYACDFPETAFCDQKLCYPADQDTADIVITENESFEFKMNFYPYNDKGCCELTIKVQSRQDANNWDTCFFKVCNVSSVGKAFKPVTTIYPNPANNAISIVSDNPNAFQVVIYDILGNEVLNKRSVRNDDAIDIAKLPTGVYVVRVDGEISSSTTFRKL